MALLSKILARRRYATIAPYIKGDVLDLGCYDAHIYEKYAREITTYCGVERSASAVKELSRQYPAASFYTRDLDCDPLALGKQFDCVLILALIEHLFNQKFVMQQVAKVLKPSGIIVIITPTPFGNDVVHRWGAVLGLFAKSAVDDHICIYNRQRFRILASEIGLTLRYHRYFQVFCNQIALLEKPAILL